MGRKYTLGESSRNPRAEPPKIFKSDGLFNPASRALPWGRKAGLRDPPTEKKEQKKKKIMLKCQVPQEIQGGSLSLLQTNN
jgi:hypothetical protein